MSLIARHSFKADGKEGCQYWFWCPGCDCAHAYTVPPWAFNGNMEKPSFSPSLLCNPSHPQSRCHLVMTDGIVSFCGDCWHEMAGQTIKMTDVPEWLV